MTREWKILLEIFWIFFKLSPAAFGGGHVLFPLIEKEIVDKRKWLKMEDVADLLSLSQSVPGAIAINSATFVGQRISGIKGSIVALIGISFPTFFIVLFLGSSLHIFMDYSHTVEAAFISIRASILALIISTAIKVGKVALIDKTTFGIIVFGVLINFFLHPIFTILLGAFSGMILIIIKEKLGYKNKFSRAA